MGGARTMIKRGTWALELAGAVLVTLALACQTTATIGRKLSEESGETQAADEDGTSENAGSDASDASDGSGEEGDSESDDESADSGSSDGKNTSDADATSEGDPDEEASAEAVSDTGSADATSGEDDVCPHTNQRQTCSGCMRAECCVEIDLCDADETCDCHWGCAGAFPGSSCSQACDPLEPPSSTKYTALIECGMRNCTFECQPGD